MPLYGRSVERPQLAETYSALLRLRRREGGTPAVAAAGDDDDADADGEGDRVGEYVFNGRSDDAAQGRLRDFEGLAGVFAWEVGQDAQGDAEALLPAIAAQAHDAVAHGWRLGQGPGHEEQSSARSLATRSCREGERERVRGSTLCARVCIHSY